MRPQEAPSPPTSPGDPAALSPAEQRALTAFLEDISVAFGALYQMGEIKGEEYLDAILAEFDGFVREAEGQEPSSQT